MDITRDCRFPPLWWVCVTAAVQLLFVALSTFSFVFSKWNACSIGWKSVDWLSHCRIFYFTFKNSWLAFTVCFGSFDHLYYEVPCNQLCCIWLNVGRQYIPIHFRILPAASVFLDVFLAKSNQALFVPCGEPSSVFVLMKSSLDCRH